MTTYFFLQIDGMTIDYGTMGGRNIEWAATCSNTYVPYNLQQTSQEAGSAAQKLARLKQMLQKYCLKAFAV